MYGTEDVLGKVGVGGTSVEEDGAVSHCTTEGLHIQSEQRWVLGDERPRFCSTIASMLGGRTGRFSFMYAANAPASYTRRAPLKRFS